LLLLVRAPTTTMPKVACTEFNLYRIAAVSVSDLCRQSSPCAHDVRLHFKDETSLHLGVLAWPVICSLWAVLDMPDTIEFNHELAAEIGSEPSIAAIYQILDESDVKIHVEDIVTYWRQTAPSWCHHYEGKEDMVIHRVSENNQCGTCASALRNGHCPACCYKRPATYIAQAALL
jgi:hypothetical protein